MQAALLRLRDPVQDVQVVIEEQVAQLETQVVQVLVASSGYVVLGQMEIH